MKPRTEFLRGFLFLAVVCALLRLAILLNYVPVYHTDTSGYTDLADQIRRWDFREYIGARTPVYPLLIWLVNSNLHIVWFIQLLFGVVTSLLLYTVAHRRTGSVTVSFLIGLAHSLCINQLFYESSILSEATATFLLMLSVWWYARMWRESDPAPTKLLVLGLITLLAGLTRPILFLLAPVFCIFLLHRFRQASQGLSISLRRLVVYCVPVILGAVVWSTINQVLIGYWGISSLLGYNLIQHSGGFIERADPKYATIQDIYLEYCAERIELTGEHLDTIWEAQSAMLAVTGMTYSELSESLTSLSLDLFIRYPDLYLGSVVQAWIGFWQPAIWWVSEAARTPQAALAIATIWRFESWVLIGVNVAFLLVGGIFSIRVPIRGTLEKFELESLVSVIVLGTSVATALTARGDNGRWAVPFEPLMIYAVVMFVWYAWRAAQLLPKTNSITEYVRRMT